jgi:hypothetical protein
MHKELFFVESIFSPQEGDNSVVTLVSTKNDEIIVNNYKQEQLLMNNHSGSIREGSATLVTEIGIYSHVNSSVITMN